MKIHKLLIALFPFILFSNIVFGQNFPEKSNRLVSDYAQALSTAQVQSLEQKLVAFDDSTTTQIAVVIIKSLGEYEVSDYAVRLAQKWGIGGKEHDNGILLLVSVEDRKVTIQTGYGVEGAVPDAIAYRIINEEIKPAFVREDYYTGINNATDALMAYTKGEYKAKPQKKGEKGIPIGTIIFVVLVILAVASGGRGGGKGGGKVMGSRGSTDLLLGTLLGTMLGGGHGRGGGFGGGGFGGGGGGGFGGFGGGGFGGGGSSGSW